MEVITEGDFQNCYCSSQSSVLPKKCIYLLLDGKSVCVEGQGHGASATLEKVKKGVLVDLTG